jgi:hypothetical protein
MRAELALYGLLLSLLVPFAGRAFHIDDRIYLEIADNILRQPLFPYDYSPVFEGLVTPDAASHSHLPLTSYYLALLKLVRGNDSEIAMHLAFLVFPAIALWSFLDLCRFYVGRRAAATALLITSPAFVVLGHSLMPDLPLLALWLLALSRFFRITHGSSSRTDWLLLATGLLGAAFLSLLTAGLLLLMAAHLWLNRRPGEGGSHRLLSMTLALPLLLWVAWYLLSWLHYDRFVLVNTFRHMAKREAFDWSLFGLKAVSFTANIGAVFVCPLAFWVVFAGRWRTRLALLAGMLALVPFALWIEGWQWLHAILLAVFLASGCLVLAEFCLLLRDGRPQVRVLLLWFFGILAACLTLYYAGSVRYVLLALPPVVLAWMMRLEHRIRDLYLQRNVAWAAVVLTVLWTIPLALADYEFAGVYRNAARELVRDYRKAGVTVWFTGEWGFRYYLEQEGARLMRRDEVSARPGDIILKPYIASPWVTVYDGPPGTVLLEQRVVESHHLLRLLDFSSHAGFYSTGWGLLPFSLSTGEPWEWFNVFRIERAWEGPPPSQGRHF